MIWTAWTSCCSAPDGIKSGAAPITTRASRLTTDAAAYLATLPLKGVGEDTISLDPCDSVDFPNHIALLGADFVNTENLTGLDALIGRRFTFVTLPLKFENSDGCSCRAIAMEE